MTDEKTYFCPNPDCENCASEPGVCSGCGSELEEEWEVTSMRTVQWNREQTEHLYARLRGNQP